MNIVDDNSHKLALKRLDELFDLKPVKYSADWIEIHVLSDMIEEYEIENYPIDKPSEESIIQFKIDNN